jgi:isoleucyl-tRNA synthetase
MPFAQWGAPHRNNDEFEATYPADFICEAIDQTRGWFYTLMAIGTLVFDRSSYRNVVCLGHILDEQGRKMSKHLGNVLEPIPLMDEHGADAVRWFMAAGGSPWQSRRVGHAAIQEVVRKVLLTYWNTVSFQSLYAGLADWSPESSTATPAADRPEIDRWALSQAHRLARDVDAALDDFDTQRAGRLISSTIDDLSNWYVRRSRRRFWAGDADALHTLHECLRIVTLVMAPLTPFVTEKVWGDLFATTSDTGTPSVHLATWPEPDADVIDDDLSERMALVRRIVELGRAARAESGVRTRQPLARALVSAPGWSALSDDLRSQVADELNVRVIEELGAAGGDLIDVSVKANFRALGRRFGQRTPIVAAAVAATDGERLVAALRDGTATIDVEGESVVLSDEDVIVTETPREGWAVVSDDGASCALDLTLTDELLRAGAAREIVRALQEARKGAGLEVTDRITVTWMGDDAAALVMAEHSTVIADEVLATSITRAPASGDAVASVQVEELGLSLTIGRA